MKRTFGSLLVIGLLLAGSDALAHPGSGIVVDRDGNVFFIDTGSGVWKIDTDGNLTQLSALNCHWIAIDIKNRLAAATLPSFPHGGATVTRDSGDPRIIVSSDFPIATGSDGSLYYPWAGTGKPLEVFRLEPSGTTTVVKTFAGDEARWLNGIAAAGDGSIYVTEDKAIKRISAEGDLTIIASGVTLSGCDSVPGVGMESAPYFRGLDVDEQGILYVAATACRAVLKITADRTVTTVLRSSSPWSPTAVAVSGDALYVLEYLHTARESRREWLPRVRKVSPDGSVVTLATIDRP